MNRQHSGHGMAQARTTQDRAEARPGLDTLSQTIDSLEARLSEMMKARAADTASSPSRRLPPVPDYRDRAPRDRRPPIEPGNARVDAELREISRTLKDLRQSVRDDFTASLRDELSGLHSVLSQVERQTDTREIDGETRSELLRISEGVDWLLNNAAADDDSRLMAEFDHLQSLLRGLADAKSVARLESRFDNIERQIAPFDPARLDLELTTLARGLDEVRRFLETDDSGHSLQDIEARMTELAGAMEMLCTRIPASGERLDGQMHAIERRIDDIDRNLERIGRRQNETTRDPAVERLEARLSELSNAVAAVDWQMRDQSAKQATLLENLDDVARRIESHGNSDRHQKLESRLEALTAAVDRLGPGLDRNALGDAVNTLSGKIGDIDIAGLERRIASRLEAADGFSEADRHEIRDHAARLEGLIESRAIDPRVIEDAVARINNNIASIDLNGAERRITAKLDTLVVTGMSDADRREIRDQIASLATMIENSDRGIDPHALENAVASINDNIARIDLNGAERRLALKIEAAGAEGFSASDRRELKARLAGLSELIENKSGIEPAAFENAVSRISAEIGGIGLAATEARLSRQIASIPAAGPANVDAPELTRTLQQATSLTEKRIAERIDALDMTGLEERLSRRIAAVEQNGAETRLSAQLSALAARLEESRNDSSGDELQKLERQIAELTTLMNRPETKLPIGELEERIGARIEAFSASNDDFVLEAAQHAAQEALKTFEADRKDQDDEHIHLLKQLAADLKTLQKPSGAERSSAGLKDTLTAIAGHIDAMPDASDNKPAVQPARASAPFAFETHFDEPVKTGIAPKSEHDDVLDILSRVRAGKDDERQEARAPVLPTHERPIAEEGRKRNPGAPAGVRSEGLAQRAPRADLIAAARRAVHSAVSDADEDASPTETGERAKSNLSRRPVYLAAGAILLALMSYPLLTDMGSDREAILKGTQSFQSAAPKRETARQAPAAATAQPERTAALDLTMTPAVKSNFAPEPEIASAPVSAFQMIEADNDLITGSITPDDPADPGALPTLADKAPETSAKLQKAALALENKPEAPVQTAAVTTKEVLDVLNAPAAPAKASGALPQEDIAVAQPEENATQAPQAAVDGAFQPITADLPAGLETQLLADAARAGDPAALYEIGLRYLDGAGFDKDLGKAAFWFDLAAERGSAPAAFQLGSLYEKGAGIDGDTAKAVALYREAAEAGNVSAMHNLAVLLANGADGAKPDFEEAVNWFAKAADHGVADSQFNLAILYARGAGVEADLTQSYKWFAVAAKEGDTEAAKRRNEVAEALTDADLRRAETLVAEWKMQPLDESANRLTSPKEWIPDDLVPTVAAVDKETVVRDIQTILNKSGYDAGPADGKLGARTDAAIRAFQKANGLPDNGAVTPELVEALLARGNA